jgi:hypothetical protein
MADRYQDRAYSAGHGRSGDPYGSDRDENDPLAELARLIGQTDPFGNLAKAGGQPQQRSASPSQAAQQDYYEGEEDYAEPAPEVEPPPGPPSWMQRTNIRRDLPRDLPREIPSEMPRALAPEPEPDNDGYLSPVHPLQRYARERQPEPPQPDPYYDELPAYQPQAYEQQAYSQQAHQQQAYQQRDPQAYAEAEPALDPSRYDDALYGQLENGVQDFQREAAYPDDPYAYQGEYDEEPEQLPRKRGGLPLTVAAVLALGVFGVAAAYGYHSYFGTTRSGEIPIIKADNSPTKVVPQQADAGAKLPDRMQSGDGSEKIVPREEQPVDVNARNVGPRVVFPPLNQNANPPTVASVTPTAMPPAPPPSAGPAQAASNGTLPNAEPRKIRTFSVKGDQPDPSAVPVNAQQAAAPAVKKPRMPPPTQANASANGPLSLAPQAAPPEAPPQQVASTNPTQIAPSPPASGGGYLVSILSQPSEAEARAAFRSMQSKYPAVLSSQSPVIARASTKNGGTTYRAGVSFATSAEASQFCHSYEAAGGQCWVVKN